MKERWISSITKLNSLIKNKLTNYQILTLSFLLAFCSFFYELCFAQLLSSLLGGTYLQYALTIGLFTSSLGMGTLIYEKLKSHYKFEKIFTITELLLILTILSTPWLMIIMSNRGFNILLYLPVIMVGLLTGVELPLLISQKEKLLTKTLAADYSGMIIASIVFPLFLFPKFGILPSLFLVCMINIFSISSLILKNSFRWIVYLLLIINIIIIILNVDKLNELSSYLLELRHV
jgi:spermidine synthase